MFGFFISVGFLPKKYIKEFYFNQVLDDSRKIDLIKDGFDRIKEKPDEYKLKEVHEYAMILPEKYYGPGSYDNWMRVGWALRNTGFELYLTWLKLSSQSSEFDWGDVGNL